MTTDECAETDEGSGTRPRPQSLMLSFLGNFVLGRDIGVSSGSFIDVFARVGVSEHAARSTLSRMARRGHFHRERHGRQVYYGLTRRCAEILADGERRIWTTGVVNQDADAPWTLLSFSLPEGRQRDRHDLRSRLTWAGFGPLGNGLWIAPSELDACQVIDGLGIDDNVRVFHARPAAPTEVGRIIADAFDLADLTARYRRFLERWDTAAPVPEAPDDLARLLLLMTDWLQTIRRDPRVPLAHLPDDWPAVRAQKLVHELHGTYAVPARAEAERVLDTVPMPPSD
ncbi:PaaX family transcriptional regulator [Nocardiopsis sp. EMB25]|uniref:PaaX family transcriptional regulator n=1 Tax=Nocardiopsis sp. EMB25 TaxID=2835867 RepID=UPI002284230D|nr:PaaX family transcriptional regulator C-terminal domain-containing protein [Nocardiopsis sp. EMB25]MCY9784241.1 PaaX family transcriptional regulator [Nocardiopsis sp. EMB25]